MKIEGADPVLRAITKLLCIRCTCRIKLAMYPYQCYQVTVLFVANVYLEKSRYRARIAISKIR